MGSTLVIEAPGTVRLIQRSILFTKAEGDRRRNSARIAAAAWPIEFSSIVASASGLERFSSDFSAEERVVVTNPEPLESTSNAGIPSSCHRSIPNGRYRPAGSKKRH